MASKIKNVKRNAAIPYLCTKGAESAIEFYKKAFGAVEVGERHPYEGKVGHAELSIEGALFMLADEYPEFNRSPKTLGGSPVSIHIQVKDVDSLVPRAVASGVKVLSPLKDEPFGRICKLEDPFGHVWFFNTVSKRTSSSTKGSVPKARKRK